MKVKQIGFTLVRLFCTLGVWRCILNFLSLAGVTMKYRDRLRTSPSAPLGDMAADLTSIMFLNAVVTMGMFLFSLME